MSIRLFILGTLSANGPMHGHQIRLQAQSDRTEQWTDVRVGSLYGALKRLALEGLVEEVRSEREGNLPERTVYGITRAGRAALRTVHDEALRKVAWSPDPFDLALAHARDVPEETLAHIVVDRLAALAAQEAALRHQLEFADPYLTEAERMVLNHLIARKAVEVRWHEDLVDRLPKIAADFEARREERDPK